MPNQEPASAWIFGKGPVRVGTQGLFRPYLKTFVLPFLSTRLTAPGYPRMIVGLCHSIFTDQYIFETLIFHWRALFISRMWASLHFWAHSKHNMGKKNEKSSLKGNKYHFQGCKFCWLALETLQITSISTKIVLKINWSVIPPWHKCMIVVCLGLWAPKLATTTFSVTLMSYTG